MELEKVLHMNEGAGEDSYASNSLLQRGIMTKAMPIVEEALQEMYNGLIPECLMMADFGCSSSPNALFLVSEAVNIISEASRSSNRRPPQIGVFLNDLPGNDFNTLFKLLPSFYKRVEDENKDSELLFGSNCFASGTPKSFYGRVFPDKFLHFVHSSSSLHWLSQVPKGLVSGDGIALNKGQIHPTKTSPPQVGKEYYEQFKRDFTLFLRSRAREMVAGGRMVLTFLGTMTGNDPESLFELLGSVLYTMVLEGLIEEEKLNSFNVPIYAPTVEQVRELVEGEPSFGLNKLQPFTVDWVVDTTQNFDAQAEFVAREIRAACETLLTTSFDQDIMDDIFRRF